EAKRVRKDAAMAKLREQKAAQDAERAELRAGQAALVKRSSRSSTAPPPTSENDEIGELGGALELAKKAHGVKQELTKAPKKGDKSWVKSAVASTLLGPLGWLYAGSMREAIPAGAAWLAFGFIASKLIPMFL